jgi:hypothetical protein
VSRFLAFSNKNQDLEPDLRLEKFLNQLRSQKKIADWQVRQADEALRLYIHHFLDGKISVLSPNVPQERFPDISKILGEIREAIRIKHYSYRTERSYLEWAERFIDYTSKMKKIDVRAAGLDSGDVKDFLSYLALTSLFAFISILIFSIADTAFHENEPVGYRPPDILFKRDPVTAPFTLLLAKNGGEEWTW